MKSIVERCRNDLSMEVVHPAEGHRLLKLARKAFGNDIGWNELHLWLRPSWRYAVILKDGKKRIGYAILEFGWDGPDFCMYVHEIGIIPGKRNMRSLLALLRHLLRTAEEAGVAYIDAHMVESTSYRLLTSGFIKKFGWDWYHHGDKSYGVLNGTNVPAIGVRLFKLHSDERR